MKINDLSVRDVAGNELGVGDRVQFNISACAGFGEKGTITKIERDTTYADGTIETPYGDDFQYVCWVKWDVHGHEIGECFDVRKPVQDWLLISKGTIQARLV